MNTVSYGNEWINWGDCGDGVAMSTKNVGELLMVMVNLWVKKLDIDFDGPQYDPSRDSEYETLEEISENLEHLKSVLESLPDE